MAEKIARFEDLSVWQKARFLLDSIVGVGDNECVIPSGSSLFRWPRASRGAGLVLRES